MVASTWASPRTSSTDPEDESTVMNDWFFAQNTLARDGWESVVDQSIDGWQHTGIRIGTLGDGVRRELASGDVERMIVPLDGDVVVEYSSADASGTEHLAGRVSVFHGPADVAYLGVGVAVVLTGHGRVAVAEGPATEHVPVQVMRSSEVPVEIRGAGRSTRQVHNFGTPAGLRAQKLIVCEVITPAENWSSFPAHKHDTTIPGVESNLEEIYYFETAVSRGIVAPDDADPFGMFATYASPGKNIAINQLVRTGDIALVPFGYHGPAVAAPGYDMYYLNVMAGPDPDRAWNITDDPAHGWIRQTWEGQAADARLPYANEPEGTRQ
jgi:5-deoxy-glucuronate isomerase